MKRLDHLAHFSRFIKNFVIQNVLIHVREIKAKLVRANLLNLLF
jgi:hypothetical protein